MRIISATVISLFSILSYFVDSENNATSPTVRPSKSVAPTTFTLTTSQAYTWNRIYPQSCTCVVSGALKKTCELFKCTCTCDLTAQVCDYNCCCDPDCSNDQVSRFSSINSCAYQGASSDTVDYCYSSAQLYGVNPRSPLEGQPALQQALGSALCVTKKNNAYMGDFLSPTPVQSSSTVFSSLQAQKPFSYLPTTTATVAVASDGFYDRNDSIAAFYNHSQRLVSNGPGFMQLPQADFTGQCNDNNFVRFEVNVRPDSDASVCLREVRSADAASFSAQCEAANSVERFVSALLLARRSSTTAALGTAQFSDVLPVQLQQVLYADFASGSETDMTAQWTAAGSVCRSAASSSSSSLSQCAPPPSAQSRAIFANASAVCRGWVRAVAYEVRHSSTGQGSIDKVLASVLLTDMPLLSATGPGRPRARQVDLQRFSVTFRSNSSTAFQTQTNGNLDARLRSGNPGYLVGKPVLFGQQAFTGKGSVVYPGAGGLLVPSPATPFNSQNPPGFGSGSCPLFLNDSAAAMQVLFGQEVAAGCVLRLTRPQLVDLCCAGSQFCAGATTTGSAGSGAGSGTGGGGYSSPYLDDSGVPAFLQFQTGYVGVYGNADPLDSSQWLPLQLAKPSNPVRQWSEVRSTCSNMYTGLNVQFLVAATGEKLNPQNKIVAARAELVVSDWTMSVSPQDLDSAQSFPLSVAVSFVSLADAADQDYAPPPPPVLFKVPYDVFYPFSVNSGRRAAHLQTAVHGGGVLASLLLVLLLL